MSFSEAIFIAIVGVSVVYLLGFTCLKLWEKSNPAETLVAADDDGFDEVIVCTGNDWAHYDWDAFQRRHIVTFNDYPQHVNWTAAEWNVFLKERKIFDGQTVNSIISTQDKDDLLEDFASMYLYEQFEMHSSKGKLYKSLRARTVYHMIRENVTKDEFSVYKDSSVHYLAVVEVTKFGSKNSEAWFARTPVHFESRHSKKTFDITDSEQIL